MDRAMEAAATVPRRKRGPVPRISREAVLAVARKLPEERRTMTAIGAELGVTAGALYRYFPDRAAMVDTLALEVRDSLEPPSARLGWRRWLKETAQLERSFWIAHPELRDAAARMAAAQPSLRMLEVGLEVLTRDGFTSEDALGAVTAMSSVGFALSQFHPPAAAVVDPELRVEAQALFDRFGLTPDIEALAQQVINITLDGIAVRLAAHRPG